MSDFDERVADVIWRSIDVEGFTTGDAERAADALISSGVIVDLSRAAPLALQRVLYGVFRDDDGVLLRDTRDFELALQMAEGFSERSIPVSVWSRLITPWVKVHHDSGTE